MKIKNILLSLLVIIGTLFTTTVKAETTAPNSFIIKAKDLYSLRGSEILGHGSTIHFAYKKTIDGKIPYCTEIHDGMVTSGSEIYTLTSSTAGDPRFAYIMEHGYPNVSITGDKDKDYFITGLAIWYLIEPNDYTFTNFNLSKGTYKGYDSDVVKAIAKLVNDSKNASYATPSLKLNSSDSNLTLSSDGKYYVSSAIGVKANNISGNKYIVSLDGAPKGTIITDTNGNTKNEFTIDASFIVKVPVSSVNAKSLSFKINAKATGTINKAYIYKPSDSSHQNLTALYPENFDLNDSTPLNLTVNTKVIISKEDITNKGKELPGASLVVKNKDGKEIDKWVSTNEPHVIENLEPGKYTLTETIAPEGYELSKETIEFEYGEDGKLYVAGKEVDMIVMYNKPEEIVEVPSTSSFKTITASLIGLLIIGLGSVILYRNYKKHEEI